MPTKKYLTTQDIVERLRKAHGDKLDYSKVVYVNATTPVTVICRDCGYTWGMRLGYIYGVECRECLRRIRIASKGKSRTIPDRPMSASEFESRCRTLYADRYEYFGDYKSDMRGQVKIHCKKHNHTFFESPYKHLYRRKKCPKCKVTKGETKVESKLIEFGIPFETQKRFSDCRIKGQLSFDFFIPSLKMCIEFDGVQHFSPVKIFGGEDAFRETQHHDAIKQKFCDANGLRLVRIPFNQYDVIDRRLFGELLIALTENIEMTYKKYQFVFDYLSKGHIFHGS